MAKWSCFIVAMLVLIPTVGINEKLKNGAQHDFAGVVITNTTSASTVGDVDQKQEKADDFVKIYGDKFYAQSFKPSKCGFDGIDLLIARHGLTGKILKQIFGEWIDMFNLFLGDIVVAVYGELGDIFTDENVRNSLIFETRIKAEEIERKEEWIHISFDVELHWNKTYYIVVYQEGGNEFNYYKWYYGAGDPYENGSFYREENYNWQWQEDANKDFCFRTYAYTNGEEGDGIKERWAILFDINPDVPYPRHGSYHGLIGQVKDCLVDHGWEEDHIKMIFTVSYDELKSAILELDTKEDGDDLVLLCSNTHGYKGGIALEDRLLSYDELNSWLDGLGAEAIIYCISACHSGSAIPIMGCKGRIIMTACGAFETGATAVFLTFLFNEFDVAANWGYYDVPPGPNGAFARNDCDLNGDGWVSAEEAFPFAMEWTEKFHMFKYPDHPTIHPEMYDGYDGELLITKVS